MNDYYNKIKQIIIEKTGLDAEEITKGSYFQDDLNIGEMELSEILEEVEDAFHVDLADDKDEIESVQDLLDILSDRLE